LTNGKMDDPVEMTAEQGHVERWRLLNPSNARTMSVSLSTGSMRVIATDGGLLENPYETDRIEIAVGQRYDIEVRYPEAGTVELLSNVFVLDDNDEVVEAAFPVVNVSVNAAENEMRLIEWPIFEPIAERAVDETAAIAFDAVQGEDGIEWQLNGVSHREDPLFVFDEGTTVRFTLDNKAGPEHPFHLHGQFFRVLGGEEPGFKDTVLVPGQSKVEIEAYMDNPGHWMLHCHIQEHAALGMMAELHVTPAATSPE
jgi:FtsP/CotA-like multicopper oxidase with cupredoxin domain